MKKITKLMLTLALCVLGVGSANAAKIAVKTPVLLTGGKSGANAAPSCFIIEMNGSQNFVAYENAEGVSVDADSYMQFDMDGAVNNGGVRVTFTFSDNSTRQEWWCLGIGTSADDTNTLYGHDFDESKYWFKKGLSAIWDDITTNSLKITKVVVNHFGGELKTYKVQGGTIAGQQMTIKNDNASSFGYYGAVFSPTESLQNIFKFKPFSVGDNQKVVIEFGAATPAGWAYVKDGNWPSDVPTGITKLEIPLSGTDLSEFSIFNWNADPTPINIKEVYLYKEIDAVDQLTFDDFGYATSNTQVLVADGGLSYNSSTGALTSDGTAGTLTLVFEDPVDLSNLNSFDVRRSGNDNIVNRLEFYDEDGKKINTWNGSKWYNTGLDNNATRAFVNNKPVKKLVWVSDEDAAKSSMTMTINEIRWQLKTISAIKGTNIVDLPYSVWDADGDNDATAIGSSTPDKNFNKLTDMIYGKQNIGDSKNYVDLTGYKKLIVRGYGTIRLFYNWSQSPVSKPIDASSFVNNSTTVKTMELDIPTFMTNNGCTHFHLIGVKGSGNCYVESISVLDGTENCDYYISGKGGLKLLSAVDALADDNATSIDVTGLTNSTEFKVTLTSANPNCLFVANDGQLANAQNVIVDDVCANLVLTDGHPFKAPANFTATAASYTTTIDATAKAGTLCLPFAATIPEGVEAYTLTYTSGTTVTATKIDDGTIPANTPVLLNGEGDVTFTGAGAVSATATNAGGALTGVFEKTPVPVNSFVLQNGSEGVGFYKVASTAIYANPFRAYLTAQAEARCLNIVFADKEEEVTGIQTVKVAKNNGVIFNLNGQRMNKLNKGLNIIGGKKVMVK